MACTLCQNEFPVPRLSKWFSRANNCLIFPVKGWFLWNEMFTRASVVALQRGILRESPQHRLELIFMGCFLRIDKSLESLRFASQPQELGSHHVFLCHSGVKSQRMWSFLSECCHQRREIFWAQQLHLVISSLLNRTQRRHLVRQDGYCTNASLCFFVSQL